MGIVRVILDKNVSILMILGGLMVTEPLLAQISPNHQGRHRRVTSSGNVFHRDRSVPALGEAWRDPSGVIWGNTVKISNNNSRVQNLPGLRGQAEAEAACARIGASLPTFQDFDALRRYLGTNTVQDDFDGSGYVPQILPDLYFTQDDQPVRYNFWTSTRSRAGQPYIFDGYTGHIGEYSHEYRNLDVTFRCVVRP